MPSGKLFYSAKLQFQKLDTMLLNDIRLFIRDRKSLVLVMLTPFIILSILINIFYFSDVAETIKGVKLGICDLDNSGFAMESSIFQVEKMTGNCEPAAADRVAKGELRGSIVIPKGFRQNIKDGVGTELKLFVDNSKSTTAVVTTNAVKAYVSDLNAKIGTEFILDAWKKLSELNNNLRFLVANLEKMKPAAIALQERLDALNQDISAVDFPAHQQSVNDVLSLLDALEAELDYVNQSMYSMPLQMPNITTVPNVSVVIPGYRDAAESLKAYCNATSLLPILTSNPACALLNYSDAMLDGIDAGAANVVAYQDTLNQRITEFNSAADELNASISRLADAVSMASDDNSDLRYKINALRGDIAFLDEKMTNITATIQELNASVNKFLGDVVRVTDELNATISVLDTYTKKDPSSILSPVTVDEKPVFRGKLEIFYRMPALMSIILLFITLLISSSLIVNERRGGTMARIFLSPVSMFFYLFEKMIYLLLLSVIAFGSMLVATLVFAAPMEVSLQLIIVFVVASLAYVAIGILIGALSKSENTSLLTCLVVGFPMMFMSGAFNPPELMSRVMRAIGSYLPLTLHVNLVERITVYRTMVDASALFILLAMAVVLYLAAALIIRRKPTLK
jgi:ABC-type Na+ efflux pump permease subunit